MDGRRIYPQSLRVFRDFKVIAERILNLRALEQPGTSRARPGARAEAKQIGEQQPLPYCRRL